MTWSSDWLTPRPPTDGDPSAWHLLDLEPGPRSPEPPTPGKSAAAREAANRQDAAERIAAQRQAEIEEAYNRGFDDGVAAAAGEQLARVESALRMLQAALTAVQASESTWTENAREHIAALAVGVARHVIARELRGDPHVIADLTRRALTHFPANESVRVLVHPEDLSVLSAASPDGSNVRVAPGREVHWVADPAVEPGGCIVEGRRRIVDGRVDHALERIYQKLADD